MADERGTFQFGGVVFPLGTATGNSLLEDLDPALYYTLDFFAGVLQIHLGDRWAEASDDAELSDISSAIVQSKVPYDPEPYLTEAQFKFPLLAVYRDAAQFNDQTSQYGQGVARWFATFTLPPLSVGQSEQLLPFLHGVTSVLRDRIQEGSDPDYESGLQVFTVSGLGQISVKAATFGRYQGAEGLAFPSVQIELEVIEQQSTPDGAFDDLTITGTNVDLVADDDTTVIDVVQVQYPDAQD